MTFRHSRNFPIAHRDRIMAKRELYGANRPTQRPFGLIELFTTEQRRKFRLPHQGTKECAKRLRSLERFCKGTPYISATTARRDWRCGDAPADRARAAARDEVAFLKSLLPVQP